MHLENPVRDEAHANERHLRRAIRSVGYHQPSSPEGNQPLSPESRFAARAERKKNVVDHRLAQERIEQDPFREALSRNITQQREMQNESKRRQYAEVSRMEKPHQVSAKVTELIRAYSDGDRKAEEVAPESEWFQISNAVESSTNKSDLAMTMFTQIAGKDKLQNQPPLLTLTQYREMSKDGNDTTILLLQQVWSASFLIEKRADIIRMAKINHIDSQDLEAEDCKTPKQFIAALIFHLEKLT